jgi:hypothetical protein
VCQGELGARGGRLGEWCRHVEVAAGQERAQALTSQHSTVNI